MAEKKNHTRRVKAAEEPQPAQQPTGAGERPFELPTTPAGATPAFYREHGSFGSASGPIA
jgi:hypothetical protein